MGWKCMTFIFILSFQDIKYLLDRNVRIIQISENCSSSAEMQVVTERVINDDEYKIQLYVLQIKNKY